MTFRYKSNGPIGKEKEDVKGRNEDGGSTSHFIPSKITYFIGTKCRLMKTCPKAVYFIPVHIHCCFTPFAQQLSMEDAQVPVAAQEQEEEWEENAEEYFDEYEEGDDDLDEEELARQLGAQLWQDIQATVGTASTPIVSTESQHVEHNFSEYEESSTPSNLHSVLATMKTIMGLLEKDDSARTALSNVMSGSENIYAILQTAISSSFISKEHAASLGGSLVELAQSEALFGTLRQSNASSTQLKRKRDSDETGVATEEPSAKRLALPMATETRDWRTPVETAVDLVGQALGASPRPPSSALIATIQYQLHQIYLFAVTSGGPHTSTLQEIGGLIQVLGVVSGTSGYPYIPNDVGTGVHRCTYNPECGKVFDTTNNLRNHQRQHSSDRPFRCHLCTGAFVRSHDLKRHIKLHENKAWKCTGCTKLFSRRDAIKRHKDHSAGRPACREGAIVEVENTMNENEEIRSEERRARLWNGINNSAGGMAFVDEQEEGEIDYDALAEVQGKVLMLHSILKEHVSVPDSTTGHADAAAGQANLATAIAQMQSASGATASQVTTSTNAIAPDSDAGGSTEDMAAMLSSLFVGGLSEEHAKLLELAIANAASEAQAQVDADMAMEEEEEEPPEVEEEEEEEEELPPPPVASTVELAKPESDASGPVPLAPAAGLE